MKKFVLALIALSLAAPLAAKRPRPEPPPFDPIVCQDSMTQDPFDCPPPPVEPVVLE